MPQVVRELDACIFCGSDNMTEEHLISAWAHRAFAQSRKINDSSFAAKRVEGGFRVTDGEPVGTAKVVCRKCNNEWLSAIDQRAANVLKPLIRGLRTVTLDRSGQAGTAAWIYKTALIMDAADNGVNGELAMLREGFMRSKEAGPGCVIHAGPANPPTGITVGDPPTTVFFWTLGMRPTDRKLVLTVNITSADGKTTTPGTPKTMRIPGHHLMLGGLWAYLGGQIPPVDDEALEGFAQIWPATDESVDVKARSLDMRDAAA